MIWVDIEAALFEFFNVLEHAQGKVFLDFLCASWIKSNVKGNDRVVLKECKLEYELQSVLRYSISSQIYQLDILIVTKSHLKSLCKCVSKFVSSED